MKILNFTKNELKALGVIFLSLFVFMYISYGNSLQKSRDVQRKNDVRDVANSLEAFHKKYNFYPSSQDGKVVGCNPVVSSDGKQIQLSVCAWGEKTDALENLRVDPLSKYGREYYYLSSGTRFQIYASLENQKEAEFNQKINVRNLKCGNKICNFGLSSGDTPLDMTIEDYEYKLKLERDKIYQQQADELEKLKKKNKK